MQRSTATLVVFLALVTLVLGGIHYYLWSRLVRAPALGDPWTRRGSILFVVLAALIPAGILLSRGLGRPLSRVVAGAAFGWMGVAVILFFMLLASELVRTGVLAASLLNERPLDPDRRAFLSRGIAGAVAFLAVGVAGAGTASALGPVALRKVEVTLRRLPRALSGFRVVHLSDLHLGPTLGAEWLSGIVARVNELEPDLVVITGDLVDGSVEDLRADVAPLAQLKAKHGVYFVTGNHEYYAGVDPWIAELARLGVRTLRNERVEIGVNGASFDLAGVDDWSARRHGFSSSHGADLGRAVAGRDPRRELLLLAHQPKQVFEAEELGVGLQLSGHTHGGQIFPWGFLVRLEQPYVAGLARHGDTQIYVSRGTGFWGPPMRVAAPAEIAVLELRAG